MTQAKRSTAGWVIKGTAIAVAVILSLGVLELMARSLPLLEEMAPPPVIAAINARLSLNPYQIPSAEHARHWLLRPGYVSAVADMIEAKRVSGRLEGARILEEAARAGYTLPIQVNTQGFKGPELDPAHRRPRILVIGDSVTFGMGGWDYVRAAQGALAMRGVDIEMVNGGVEGYAFANALWNVPLYRAIKPDICLIMLGWNDIFSQSHLFGTPLGRFALVDVALRGWRRIADGGRNPVEIALERRNKTKHSISDTPEVQRFHNFQPFFLDRAERLGDLLGAGGCRVTLATLPSLFHTGRQPSAYALAVGHLPDFTDNPYALAEIVEGTNAAYRTLAARKGWSLVDTAMFPDSRGFEETWFTDSVHFNAPGLTALGNDLADGLLPLP